MWGFFYHNFLIKSGWVLSKKIIFKNKQLILRLLHCISIYLALKLFYTLCFEIEMTPLV